jgi:hypothetical protein
MKKTGITVSILCGLLLLIIVIKSNDGIVSSSRQKSLNKDSIIEELFYSSLHNYDNFVIYDNLSILNVDLRDSNGDIRKLSDIIREEKLIIYLPDVTCRSCSERALQVLKDIFPSELNENIHIIARFNNKRELKIYEQNSSLKSLGLNFGDNLFSEAEDSLNFQHILFIITPQVKGICFFIPDDNVFFSKTYYKSIYQRFKNKKQNLNLVK